MNNDLNSLAEAVAGHLISRKQTVAVAESSAGGLISAALLSVPGASAYYLGGGVIYTGRALKGLLGVERHTLEGMRSSSEPYAGFLADRIRQTLRADWGLAETGAAGPTGNIYGDAAGHTCLAVSGPVSAVETLETAATDRAANMDAFARSALALLLRQLETPAAR